MSPNMYNIYIFLHSFIRKRHGGMPIFRILFVTYRTGHFLLRQALKRHTLRTMGLNGIIDRKLAMMDETLQRVREYIPDSYESFRNDWGLQKIVERSLQILVEAMIDIAERIIALEKQIPPSSSAEAIETLQRMGILTDEPSFVQMVRFRNFLVHNYDRLDDSILYDVLTNRLHHFETFRNDIIRFQNS